MSTATVTQIDPSKAFQFLEVNDTGPESGACCPHCGAEGRYIYVWAEFGKPHAAMAGCYKALTGKIKKDDVDQFIEIMMKKQSSGKPLNGWQKSVLRMQKYILDNNGDGGKVLWANQKIKEAVADQKRYAFKKR